MEQHFFKAEYIKNINQLSLLFIYNKYLGIH